MFKLQKYHTTSNFAWWRHGTKKISALVALYIMGWIRYDLSNVEYDKQNNNISQA